MFLTIYIFYNVLPNGPSPKAQLILPMEARTLQNPANPFRCGEGRGLIVISDVDPHKLCILAWFWEGKAISKQISPCTAWFLPPKWMWWGGVIVISDVDPHKLCILACFWRVKAVPNNFTPCFTAWFLSSKYTQTFKKKQNPCKSCKYLQILLVWWGGC